MALSIEYQTALRRLFDNGVNKNQASRSLGIAEATVYRYYIRWESFRDAHKTNPYVVNLIDMFDKPMIEEMSIQAKMRRMTLQNYVATVLATVIKDNLSASILDISDDHPAKKRLQNAKP